MNRTAEWVRVTRSEPCKVCGNGTYCTRTNDGAVAKCMRVESAKPAKGDAGGWIHKLDGAVMNQQTLPKVERPKPVIDWPTLAMKHYEHSKAGETRIALAEQLGLRIASLEALQVGCGWDFNGAAYSSWPQRDATGKVIGISRRYGTGEKKTMQHSSPGLHYADNWQSHNTPLFIVEGGSDTAALISMGICGVGRPSNLGGVSLLVPMLRKEKRRVIVIGEHDEKPEKRGTVDACKANCAGCNFCYPGKYGARKTAERLRESLPPKQGVSWVMLDGAKDTREWYRLNGDKRAFTRMVFESESILK